MSPALRLFVALDLPASARDEIAGWRDRALVSREDLRPVPVAGLHVTLVFLGSRDAGRVPAIWEAASAAALEGQAPPLLAPDELVGVPQRLPRLVALGLLDEGARAAVLQRAVADSLASAQSHERERRRFWPHVTLARLRTGASWRPLDGSPALAPFHATALTLYCSHLAPSGARYEALRRCELG